MNKTHALVPCLAVTLTLVAGCGDKAPTGASQPVQGTTVANSAKLPNATVKDAGDALVKALVEGDRKVIESINHSDPSSWPTTHLMKQFSEDFQKSGTAGIKVLGVEGNNYAFSINGNAYKFEFLKEKEGYFFVGVSN